MKLSRYILYLLLALPLCFSAAVIPFVKKASSGAASDPYFANVVLLAHMNGTDGSTVFTDSSASAKTITAFGNAQIDTAQSKFGGASGLSDGVGDYLSIADSPDWDLVSSGDFTIELWCYFVVDSPANTDIMGQSNGAESQPKWMIGMNDSTTIGAGNIGFHCNDGSAFNVTWAWLPGGSVWHFLQFVRAGDSWTCYADGSSLGTVTQSRRPSASSGDFRLLTDGENYRMYASHMDDVRLTKGVARPNTVPTAQFPDQ